MRTHRLVPALLAVGGLLAACTSAGTAGSSVPPPRSAAGLTGIHKIKHVIVIMQENRSFDSYRHRRRGFLLAGPPG